MKGKSIAPRIIALAALLGGALYPVSSQAFDPKASRFDDCHFSAAGQARMAEAQAKIILDHAPR